MGRVLYEEDAEDEEEEGQEGKVRKEANAKNIYPPDQVKEYVEAEWASNVPEESSTADKEQVKAIAESVVNALGAKGTKGLAFEEEKFNSNYQLVDPMGMGKNMKEVVIGLVAKMLSE